MLCNATWATRKRCVVSTGGSLCTLFDNAVIGIESVAIDNTGQDTWCFDRL